GGCLCAAEAARRKGGAPAAGDAEREHDEADGPAGPLHRRCRRGPLQDGPLPLLRQKVRMTARIIDGKAVARKLRAGYAARVERLKSVHGVQPGLAVILVGDNPASQVYVRNKVTACRDAGIHSELYHLPVDTPEEQVLARIDALNADPNVHGILVQLPLPPQINVTAVLERIAAAKDVDGFHLYNVGGLITGNTIFPPCTPYGVTKLLEHEQVPIAGQNVVVVGASNIVGKPMALMLMQQDATVCICHKIGRA